jgi:hypothetical protein
MELRNAQNGNLDVFLDEDDRARIDRALDLLELKGDAVGDLREKLDRMGVGNLRLWGRDTTAYMIYQVQLIDAGQRPVDEFIAELDNGFSRGRDPLRNEFIHGVREIAQKFAATMKSGVL